MTGKRLIRALGKKGCEVLRQQGSHARVRCDRCQTTVPVHRGKDLPPGTLRAIERDLEPCLGRKWMADVQG